MDITPTNHLRSPSNRKERLTLVMSHVNTLVMSRANRELTIGVHKMPQNITNKQITIKLQPKQIPVIKKLLLCETITEVSKSSKVS